MQKIISWIFSWLFFYIGDLVIKFRLYKLYNFFMVKSLKIQDWTKTSSSSKFAGPWKILFYCKSNKDGLYYCTQQCEHCKFMV